MLAARARDEEADELGALLFDTHHLRLFRLARRLSSNHDEARDLVQETFVRALRSKPGLPTDRQEQEAWLVTALVNLARDHRRRAAVRARNAGDVPTEPGGSPEAVYVAKIAVERALERLDPRRRAVIVLHELDGEPVKRIATLLGIAPVTVRWHLARARKTTRHHAGVTEVMHATPKTPVARTTEEQKLRDWDPTLGDAQLTDDEGREIERMLAMSPIPATTFSARRRWPPFALATGGGLVVVLLLLVAWGWHATQRTPRRDPLPSDPVATATPAAPGRVRADGATAGAGASGTGSAHSQRGHAYRLDTQPRFTSPPRISRRTHMRSRKLWSVVLGVLLLVFAAPSGPCAEPTAIEAKGPGRVSPRAARRATV